MFYIITHYMILHILQFLFLLLCLEVFLVDRLHHEMQGRSHGDEARHGVHGVVVEKWTEMKIRIIRFYFVNPGNYLGSIVP